MAIKKCGSWMVDKVVGKTRENLTDILAIFSAMQTKDIIVIDRMNGVTLSKALSAVGRVNYTAESAVQIFCNDYKLKVNSKKIKNHFIIGKFDSDLQFKAVADTVYVDDGKFCFNTNAVPESKMTAVEGNTLYGAFA